MVIMVTQPNLKDVFVLVISLAVLLIAEDSAKGSFESCLLGFIWLGWFLKVAHCLQSLHMMISGNFAGLSLLAINIDLESVRPVS